jgi:hypothetical protein
MLQGSAKHYKVRSFSDPMLVKLDYWILYRMFAIY